MSDHSSQSLCQLSASDSMWCLILLLQLGLCFVLKLCFHHFSFLNGLCLFACCALKSHHNTFVLWGTEVNSIPLNVPLSVYAMTSCETMWGLRQIVTNASSQWNHIKVLFNMPSVLHWSLKIFLPHMFMDMHLFVVNVLLHFVLLIAG